jgi:predicted dithiol-disulfide oxidoreductase (DUF899 family)
MQPAGRTKQPDSRRDDVSNDSNFNRDFHVSFTKDEVAKGEAFYNYGKTKDAIEELPGLSVFTKDSAS